MADADDSTNARHGAAFRCGHCRAARQGYIPTTQKYCSARCALAARALNTDARFWSKVDKNGPISTYRPDLGRCWLWTARRFRNGYGQFKQGRWTTRLAHRVVWLMTFGPIPPETPLVLHNCHQRDCVNPSHLRLGTHWDNSQDAIAANRQAKGDRSGSRLHPERLARGDRNGARLYPERQARRVGEDNPAAKLTEILVLRIRSRYARGEPSASIARDLGIGRSNCWLAATGRTWAHLPIEPAAEALAAIDEARQ